jgi:DNA-binding transcriptional ArsR family regulator
VTAALGLCSEDMKKRYETKKATLELLSVRSKTLTELSRELGLAPSTVSQHLKELVAMGAVVRVENEHVKKWKYYQKVSDFDASIDYRQNNVPVYNIKVPYIAIRSLGPGYILDAKSKE